MKKRVLSLLLVLSMVLGLLPTGALAVGATEIATQEDLAGMSDGSDILTADIGLNEWTAIDFSGTLDGNGHTITLAGQPLFNELSGNVQNLCLSGEVTDEDGIVGALARTQTGGAVNNCWSGAEYDWYAELFAGFIGTMTGGTIKNCLSTCDMGDAGLVAEVSGQSAIENCYYTHYNAVYNGEFTGSGNESISSSDYERVMVQLNGNHEEGLLYWAVDTDGVPKPMSNTAPEADDAVLQALYDSVKDMTNTVPDEEGVTYTSESWAAFEAARTEAKDVLDSADATQAVIDAAKEALQAAIDGLIPDRTTVTAAERKALEAEIANAPSEKGRYTDASFAAVQTALKPAEALLQNPAATSEQLAEQTNALKSAIEKQAEITDPAAVTELPEGQEWTMISTAEQLAELSTSGGTGYYKLANDISGYVGIYDPFGTQIKPFNGVLDGNGFTVIFAGADKTPNPVVNILGPNGVIQNLGVNGSITNVPLVDKLYGKLLNCYSWADTQYGGLVGTMFSGSVIANCYVNQMPGGNGGGLVMTGNGGHILHSYWPEGKAIGTDTGTSLLDSQAVDKQKEDGFRAELNAHRYGGMEWHQSDKGLPWLGEEQEYVKPNFKTVTVTSLITGETASIDDPDDVLKVSVFGEPGGSVATLTIDGYQGDQLEWETPSHATDAPIMVYYDKKAGHTSVWVRDAGTVTVTAFLKGTEETPRKELQSFQIEAKAPGYFDLKLKIDGVDYTNKTYEVQGSEGFELVPYVSVEGKEIPVYYGLFDWDSSNSAAIHVDSDAWVTIYKEGTANLTASLNGVSASVRVTAGYTQATGIECLFDGTYTIHRRSPNSVGQNGTPGEASFNPLRHLKDGEEWVGSEEMMAKVLPEGATYANRYDVTTDKPEIMEFQSALVQNLIPMKAGTVNVTVTTKDPKLEQQFTDTKEVTLKYLNPLKELSVQEEKLTVKVGETIDAGLIFTGENDTKWPEKYPSGLHVSESYMTWEQSGEGQVLAYRSYPVIMQGDKDFSLEEGTVSNDQWLIKGVKEGTVVLKGTAKDTTNGEKIVTLTITVEAGDPSLNKPVEEQVADALAKTGAYQLNALNNAPAFLNEWSILGLARAGIEVPENFYETYYASAYEKVQEQKKVSSRPWDNKITETQRLALALTAIGKNPADVGGVNLLDYSWNKEAYWNGAVLGDMQGSNELIYALLAINAHDSLKEFRPESVTMTEQQMLDKLLGVYQAEEGGFGLSGPSFDVDITGMALQALAPYYNTRNDVKTAVDKAVTHLSQAQGTDGSYGNPEATSQVIVALCTLGIDPDKDERFIKAGSSLVDGLLMYALEDGSFWHSMNGGSDGMATEQALYTLAALSRFYADPRGNSLYDMNDVAFGGSGGTTVTGVTLTPTSAEIEIGKKVQLNALVIPATAANKNVTFSSDKPEVATVSETGLVTGVAEGIATITVTTADGGKTASAVITVTKAGEIKPEDKATVTLSIDKLTINKGYVLSTTKVEITKGETVWDMLKRELDQRRIDYQYSNNSQYNSVYVESIDGDGEFDHGSGSGWKCSVNGIYPDYGCSRYELSGGEVIKWRYTTNLGEDLGDDPNGGQTGKPEQGGSAVLRPEVKPDKNGSVQVAVDAAQMKNAIAQAKTEGSAAIVIAPQITGDAVKVTVEVPTQSLKDMVKSTDAALEVETDAGSVSIPNDALEAIAQQAGGSSVTITVEAKKPADVRDQVRASQLEGAEVVDVTITSGKKELTTFGGKSLTVTIPVAAAAFAAGETYNVIVLSADGAREIVSGTCVKQNGKLSVQVKTAHLSTFVVTAQKAMPFTDVSGHWAAKAITYVYGNGLMNGTGETTFAPDQLLNRAMLAAILHRLAGEPAVTGEYEAFTDVASETWYTSAVAWASANGIVSGVGGGRFAPMEAITREQLATMLYRYARYSGLDTSAKGDLSKFTDGDQIASWASDAMAWAVGAGLLSGKTANVIDPTGDATRAEVATILMRFAELTK